jgi:hypothetical protein
VRAMILCVVQSTRVSRVCLCVRTVCSLCVFNVSTRSRRSFVRSARCFQCSFVGFVIENSAYSKTPLDCYKIPHYQHFTQTDVTIIDLAVWSSRSNTHSLWYQIKNGS